MRNRKFRGANSMAWLLQEAITRALFRMKLLRKTMLALFGHQSGYKDKTAVFG